MENAIFSLVAGLTAVGMALMLALFVLELAQRYVGTVAL